jgi:hypothetical protein
MDNGLAFGLAALQAQVDVAQSRFESVGRGVGEKFFRVFEEIFADIQARAAAVVKEAASSLPEQEPSLERNVSRLLEEVRAHDSLVAEYVADVGRDDLPVGYMVLIDAISERLLPGADDHLVHVADDWDYSTTPLGRGMIVHLPAVNPSNAFWSPVLVHEIAHASFPRLKPSYSKVVAERLSEIGAVASVYPVGNPTDEEFREALLPMWAEELFCDAVACFVTGPSFLLALVSRLVGADWTPETKHPPTELRVALCLSIFRRSGWTEVLEHHAPEISRWVEALAAKRPQTNDSNVMFLFDAAELLISGMVELASEVVASTFIPDGLTSRRSLEAARYFRHNILPVDFEQSEHFEWEVILGAWLLALERKNFVPDAIPTIPYETQLNGLIIKTIELARIKVLWAADDAPR